MILEANEQKKKRFKKMITLKNAENEIDVRN
jgi:hypothetical protein